jgi:hypothetical protein
MAPIIWKKWWQVVFQKFKFSQITTSFGLTDICPPGLKRECYHNITAHGDSWYDNFVIFSTYVYVYAFSVFVLLYIFLSLFVYTFVSFCLFKIIFLAHPNMNHVNIK